MSVICFGELLIDLVALETGVTVGEASGFVKAPRRRSSECRRRGDAVGASERISGTGGRRSVRAFSGRGAARG